MYSQRQLNYNISKPSYFIPVVVPFIIGAWLGGLRNSRADLESRL